MCSRRAAARTTEKGAEKADADFELWFLDESKLSLLPYVTYLWARRGRPCRVKTPGKNRKVAVCGALRWPDGPFISAEDEVGGSRLFQIVIKRLSLRARRTGRRIVVVMDNGSAHTAKASRLTLEGAAPHVVAHWLPPYCSDLNVIETLWKLIKQEYCARMLVTQPEKFAAAVRELMRFLESSVGLASIWRGRELRHLFLKLLRSA